MELLLVCHPAHISMADLDRSARLSLLGLPLLPPLLGLDALNFVLGRRSATTISVVLLLKTPIAAVGAWWLIRQQISPGAAALPKDG
ncbi:hypothetical protein AB0O75_20495 [Streptomyces sp. NPDC088921]|uniref:hypothetical protein n=1 Tax=unclassified Streptomyces TaxID=2593676 RepID=UPI00343AFB0E